MKRRFRHLILEVGCVRVYGMSKNVYANPIDDNTLNPFSSHTVSLQSQPPTGSGLVTEEENMIY